MTKVQGLANQTRKGTGAFQLSQETAEEMLPALLHSICLDLQFKKEKWLRAGLSDRGQGSIWERHPQVQNCYVKAHKPMHQERQDTACGPTSPFCTRGHSKGRCLHFPSSLCLSGSHSPSFPLLATSCTSTRRPNTSPIFTSRSSFRKRLPSLRSL